ncbi:MAG: tRNA 2-selenouridine(34) synthase MnmH [Pseudohongiellaceae bacterium]
MNSQAGTAIVAPECFRKLFISDTPLLDVRSPVEFTRGAFPGAVNIPLLEDSERERIGTCYKQRGREAAIALGHELVCGDIRRQRVERWVQFVRENPAGLLYCFRGGLRSRLVQQWLRECGYPLPRIAGGYKALRRFLMDTTEELCKQCDFLIVAGKTGSGKTVLLENLPASLDLEGLAVHRGSAFGMRVTPQPSQIDFENRLAIAALKLPFQHCRKIFIEDESRAVGSLSVPPCLYQKMRQAPLLVIEEGLEQRAERILQDYITANFADLQAARPQSYTMDFQSFLLDALAKIRKRLGGELFTEIHRDMTSALERHINHDDNRAHLVWIDKLLRHYYDPMYDYQLNTKLHRVVFRGNHGEFLRWAARINYTCHRDHRSGDADGSPPSETDSRN